MKPSYEFLEHTADILFQAKAETLEELFEQSALAVEESMIKLKQIQPKKEIKIKGRNLKLEYLLFDFLNDLLFYKDSQQLLFSKFKCKIKEHKEGKKAGYELNCSAFGEKLNPDKHEQKVDVKAITMHLFEVKKKGKSWMAQVLIDI